MFLKKFYTVIKQHDYKDCGCACLATICKHYGLKVPISTIREIAGTDRQGTSAFGIINAAEQLGFNAKGIKVRKPEDIFNEIPLPCIAHVIIEGKLLHYVVIHNISKNKIIIGDPAKGIVKYKIDDFFKIWTGILLIMMPTIKFEKRNNTNGLLERFCKLLRPQKHLLINIFLASTLITFLGIVGSFFYQFFIDEILPNNLNKTLHTFSIGIIILTFFKVLTNTFRTHLLMYLSQNLDIPLMLGYYEHVINLPMNFFNTREVGEVISRFNDASKIRDAISNATLTIMIDILMVIIGGIMLYKQNTILFTITIIPIIFYILIIIFFKKPIENINRDTMEKNANLTSYLIESINGIETVKAYNAEKQVNLETEKRFIKLIKAVFKNNWINNLRESLKSTIKSTFNIIILWIGGIEILNGNISIGQLLTFNALLIYFLDPIENIINLQPLIQTAIVASDRLTEIFDLELEKAKYENNKISPKSLMGNIEFRNVNFRYGKRNLILKNINFIIKSKEKVALVGESGSGKSTLVKLIMNFYQCEKGEILINDYNIKDINIESLRNKISYISQNTFLFNGTIIENLSLGNPYITYEEIIEACKKASIHDFINSLPLRYNTMIEENGANLSGGQKQRLSIARAILKKPEIFIMDEATSNLDSITEKTIEKTLNTLSKNTTTIIIAHRLSTIMKCDTIYVMNKGEIVEFGNHEKLIENKNFYFNLWKEQIYAANDSELLVCKGVE